MSAPRFAPGLVQIYTGSGKGKTTAAVGLALRALGHGFRVTMIQFMKGDPEYGELKALSRFGEFECRQSGLPTFVIQGAPSAEDLRLAAEGLRLAGETLRGGASDLVILDEILCATDFGLVTEDDVLDLLAARPIHVELVLTGRGAGPRLIAAADLVTEMREIKHPYRRGQVARTGIEH